MEYLLISPRCFDSSKYSDLIIRCEDREFKVHRIVVCGQSKYFSKICDGDWKVRLLEKEYTSSLEYSILLG